MRPSHRALALLLFALLALLSGCTTPTPVTYRTGLRQPDEKLRTIVILPIDAEVAELAAGGITEKRDDWTAQVVAHFNQISSSRRDYRVARPWPEDRAADLKAELEDVHAVFRAITLNQIIHSYLPGPPLIPAASGTLVYQIGPIDTLLDAQQADAALLLFVRDDYATAGRKGLVFLGALTGLPVRGGFTISSAALATRDGRLLWMNLYGSPSGDLRTHEGADTLLKELLAGAPSPDRAPILKPAAPPADAPATSP